MEIAELKEKLIVLGVTVGIFFPIRIFFSLYVSDNWIWSIGTMTAFAVLLVVLIKKNKLGWFGRIFEKQMRKIMGGKTGKYLIGFAIFFLVYFGATLFFMDRGDTVYADDKGIFYLAIMEKGGYNINDLSSYGLIGPKLASYKGLENLQVLASIDYMFSIAYAVMNDMSDGWLEHIVMVMFVEQIELIGILFLYRNLFKSVTKVRISN
jgi:hypothetical protein